jgi:hypothetical protein
MEILRFAQDDGRSKKNGVKKTGTVLDYLGRKKPGQPWIYFLAEVKNRDSPGLFGRKKTGTALDYFLFRGRPAARGSRHPRFFMVRVIHRSLP